jgi:hypothetical protein
MKKKLAILDKNAHWWKDSPEIKQWAIEDKDGTWWLVGGSEFPERKKGKKPMEIKKSRIRETSLPAKVKWCLLILLSSLLGVSLAVNVILYLTS